jgi:GDP-4-dehydro-6-deoxy-D-mannose reductase
MNVLITGITGMAGSHLADYLMTQGVSVFGIARWRGDKSNIPKHNVIRDLTSHKSHLPNIINADITDLSSMIRSISLSKPDIIFHLAAQSFVPDSFTAPNSTMNTNVNGTINVFEACKEVGIKPIVHVACSSEQYGKVPHNLRINESQPFKPLSVYAVSKITQENIALYYRSEGFKTVITRAFNHEGPRRNQAFVTSSFARQIAMIERGRQDSIFVGNLESVRDWTDVRDMVRAYWLAVNLEIEKPLNISSDKYMRVGEMLHILLSQTSCKPTIIETSERMRRSDVDWLWGDSRAFREITGWQPKIPFNTTLLDTLNYWRTKCE